MLERALRRLPAPHRLAATLEGANGQGAFASDAGDHLSFDRAQFRGSLTTPPVAVAQVSHPPLEEAVVPDRKQARLVGPVLEDAPLAQQPCDGRLLVLTDSRGERDPVSPVDGRDRVELDGLKPPDLGGNRRRRRSPEPRCVALMCDDEPSKLRKSNRAHPAER